MPTSNRGKEGKDDVFFGSQKSQKSIQEAVKDYSYLLTRGFAEKSSLALVGNRYRLSSRQQKAVRGMSESSEKLLSREAKRIEIDALKNQTVIIDGFNLLILLESALSGAYIFEGLDGCYRDLSSVQGTYKRVHQTQLAIQLVAEILHTRQVAKTIWVFDKPVSNSGRLKQLLQEFAEQNNYAWEVVLKDRTDHFLGESQHVVISSDSWVLDQSKAWFNLAKVIIEKHIENPCIVHGV